MRTQRPCSLSCADSTPSPWRNPCPARLVLAGAEKSPHSLDGKEHTGWTGLQPFQQYPQDGVQRPNSDLENTGLHKSENSSLQSRTPTIF